MVLVKFAQSLQSAKCHNQASTTQHRFLLDEFVLLPDLHNSFSKSVLTQHRQYMQIYRAISECNSYWNALLKICSSFYCLSILIPCTSANLKHTVHKHIHSFISSQDCSSLSFSFLFPLSLTFTSNWSAFNTK